MKKKLWTIVIQISGENNLLMDSISAFNEIAQTGSTKDINFVVLMDRMEVKGEFPESHKQYEYLKNPELAKPCVYLVTKDEFYAVAKPKCVFEQDDLYDKTTREEIYKYIRDKFPADNFGFIYKGHGQAGGTDIENKIFITKIFKVQKDEYTPDGKLKTKKIEERISIKNSDDKNEYEYSEFFCINDDEEYPPIVLAIFYKSKEDAAFLKYTELQNSLHTVFGNRGLAFVLLDCCWGMILENIHQFKDTTKYLVASPDEMPGLGIGYKLFCSLITNKPDIKPNELAKMLVAVFYTQRFDDYNDPTDKTFLHMGVSLTCVNTDAYNEKVLDGLKKLLNYLIKNMPAQANEILSSINFCKDYTYSNPHVYKVYNLDLVWFLENLIHHNKSNEKLMLHCFTLLADIQLYLIKGLVSNNYEETTLGKRFIGGKGIAITLPKTRSYFNLSIISDEDESGMAFYNDTSWKKFLTSYYEHFEKPKLLINLIDADSGTDLTSLFKTDAEKLPEGLDKLINDISGFKVGGNMNESDFNKIKTFSAIANKIDNSTFENFFNETNSIPAIETNKELFINSINTDIQSKWKKLETSDE